MKELLNQLLNLFESKDFQTFYHVSLKKNLEAIKQFGLSSTGKSNYINIGGKALGGTGKTYAFTNLNSAIRWGSKMEFDMKKPIILITYKDDMKEYTKDNNLQMQLNFSGSVIKQGSVPVENIIKIENLTSDMIKDAIRKFNT